MPSSASPPVQPTAPPAHARQRRPIWRRLPPGSGWLALSALLHLLVLGQWRLAPELGQGGEPRDAGVTVDIIDPQPDAPRPAPPLARGAADTADTADTVALADTPDARIADQPSDTPARPAAPATTSAAAVPPATSAPAPLPDGPAGESTPDNTPPDRIARDGLAPATTAATTAANDTAADTPQPADLPAASGATPPLPADVAAAATAGEWPGDWPSPVPGNRREMRAIPPSRQLDFNARAVVGGNEYFGKGSIRWRVGGGRYAIEQEVALDLLVTSVRLQTSTSNGLLGSNGLDPLRYTEKTRTRALVATNFNRDPAHNSISFSASTAVLPLEPGVQDRASVTMQLAALLASRTDEIAPGTIYHLLLAGVRGAEPWVLRVSGVETIDTPLGPLATRRVERLPRPGSRDNRVEVWLAVDHGWLPVRIRHVEPNGNLTEMTVSNIAALPDLDP